MAETTRRTRAVVGCLGVKALVQGHGEDGGDTLFYSRGFYELLDLAVSCRGYDLPEVFIALEYS